MANYRWFVTAAMAVVLGSSVNASAQQPVKALAFNFAEVPDEVLAAAQEKATATLKTGGVTMEWSASMQSAAVSLDCQTPFSVQVLIRHRDVTWAPGQRSVMGMALASDEGRAVLMIYYDAVVSVARRYHAAIDDILAIAIAHEFGHVLLPPPSHSPRGIMQPFWEGDDVRHAIGGELAFDSGQADLIQTKAARACQRR